MLEHWNKKGRDGCPSRPGLLMADASEMRPYLEADARGKNVTTLNQDLTRRISASRRGALLSCLILLIMGIVAPLQAQTNTLWTGSVNNEFGTAGNWGNGLPSSLKTAVFNEPTASRIIYNMVSSVGGIEFWTAGWRVEIGPWLCEMNNNEGIDSYGAGTNVVYGGTGTLENNGIEQVWTVASGSVLVVDSDFNMSRSLAKDGAGLLRIHGKWNDGTGRTWTISNGTFIANCEGDVTDYVVLSNCVFGGTGVVDEITIGSNSTLAVGDFGVGILTAGVGGEDVMLQNGSTLAMEIEGPVAGVGYDQLKIMYSSAALILTNVNNLALTVNYTPAVGELFFLTDMDGVMPVVGVFEKLNGATVNLSEGAEFGIKRFASGMVRFKIGYAGDATGKTFTGGNDIVLQCTGVNFPGTLMVIR